MVPRLVPPDQLVAAGALLSLRRSIGGVAAPAAAVLLIATAGAPAAYLVGLGTFLLSIALLAHVRPVPSARDAGAPPLREFAGAPGRGTPARPAGHLPGRPRRHRFALPTALFPFPAEELAAPGRSAFGLLYTASAAGSLVAAATGGWTGRVHRHGRLVLLSAALVGTAHRRGRLRPRPVGRTALPGRCGRQPLDRRHLPQRDLEPVRSGRTPRPRRRSGAVDRLRRARPRRPAGRRPRRPPGHPGRAAHRRPALPGRQLRPGRRTPRALALRPAGAPSGGGPGVRLCPAPEPAP